MRARRARFLSAALTALVAAALVCTPANSPAAASARPAVSPLAWHPCPDATSFQCATMPAPLDYDRPGGATIGIAVIRHLATDRAHRAGSVFWNPGGPGAAATVNLPAVYPLFPAGVRARFDIVALDPRGIGGSDQLRCFATPAAEDAVLATLPGGFPVGATQQRAEIDTYAQLDRACATHAGPIQYHMSTANDARDIDRARQALGESKVNYYGVSYGTYLGLTYANLFPAHAGRIVLDGNVAPVEWNDTRRGTRLGTFLRLHSPAGSQAALELMISQCGRVAATRCAFSAGSPTATLAKYRTLLQRLRAHAVTVDGQPYSYALTVAIVASSLATQNANGIGTGWKALAALLQALWTQSAHPSTATSGQPPSSPTSTDFAPQLPEGLDGVVCSESPNPANPYSYAAQARAVSAESPDGFGQNWSWLSEPCAQWRAHDADRYTGPWTRSPKPYLLIGTLGDPETAYSSTLRMAAAVPNARVLTETGGGHTALLNKSSCVDDYIDTYLADGSLPPPGAVCNQNRQPF